MKAARRDPYKKLSDEEVRLAKLWYDEDDMEPSEIAALLRRDKSTMTRLLVMDCGSQLVAADAAAQLLRSYFTVTSQLLHSYFMVNLSQGYDS